MDHSYRVNNFFEGCNFFEGMKVILIALGNCTFFVGVKEIFFY